MNELITYVKGNRNAQVLLVVVAGAVAFRTVTVLGGIASLWQWL